MAVYLLAFLMNVCSIDSVKAQVPPCPQLVINTPPNFTRNEANQIVGCAGQQIQLQAELLHSNFVPAYTWTYGRNQPVNRPDLLFTFPDGTDQFTPDLIGTITVTVTLPPTINCFQTVFTASIVYRSYLPITSVNLTVDPKSKANYCNDGRNQEALLIVKTQPSNATVTNYAWYRNNARIENATGTYHYAKESGTYRVVVSNACGSLTSPPLTVTERVIPGVRIVTEGSCGNRGLKAQLQTLPDCPVIYTWYRGDEPVNNPNPDPSVFIPTQPGNYEVEVSCNECTQRSAPFRFRINNFQQSRMWSLPLAGNNGQTINFDGTNANTLAMGSLPTHPQGYQGQAHRYCHNVWYLEDSRGNKSAHLFVVDGSVYDEDGREIISLPNNSVLGTEVAIFPVPETCGDYVVLWSSTSCFYTFPPLRSGFPWVRIRNGQLLAQGNLENTLPNFPGPINCLTAQIAVSPERNLPIGPLGNAQPIRSRLVYIRQCASLICLRVTGQNSIANTFQYYNGVNNTINNPGNTNLPGAQAPDFNINPNDLSGLIRSEMELSNDNSFLVFGGTGQYADHSYMKFNLAAVTAPDAPFGVSSTAQSPPAPQIFRFDVDPTNTIPHNISFGGIELTPDNQFCYLTVRERADESSPWQGRLLQVNFGNNPITITPVNIQQNPLTDLDHAILTNSMIEAGPNGRFFMRGHRSLISFQHRPNVNQINFNIHFANDLGHNTVTEYLCAHEHFGSSQDELYTLTDQIDGECYFDFTASGQGTNCCRGDVEFRGGNNTIQNNRQINNRTVYIDRLTILNGGVLNLFGCTVIMGEGGSIVVQDGGKLFLTGCNITPCRNMWRGIIASGNNALVSITGDGSHITPPGNFIEGALAGITVSNGADLNVTDMIIRDNIYGIRLVNYPANNPFTTRSPNNAGMNVIQGNIFRNALTFRFPMVSQNIINNFMSPVFSPAPNAFQNNDVNTWRTWNQTEAHILVENASGVTIGDGTFPNANPWLNRFENGQNAVLIADRRRITLNNQLPSVSKSCTLQHNRFQDQLNASVAFRTAYVNSLPDNNDEDNFARVLFRGNNIVGSTNIQNNLAGIHQYGLDFVGISHLRVTENTINACERAGISKINGGFANNAGISAEELTIEQNRFRNQQRACIVVDGSRRTDIEINNNNTAQNDNADSPFAIAVAVNNQSVQTILNAEDNRWRNVADGFLINNVRNPVISGNIVIISGGTNPLQQGSNYFQPFGINTQNCTNVEIRSNTISYSDNLDNVFIRGIAGISVMNPGAGQSTGSGMVTCNDLTNVTRGMSIFGNQNATFYTCNHLRSNRNGLFFERATNIPRHLSPEQAQNNRWHDVGNNFHTFCENTDGTSIPFYITNRNNAIYNPVPMNNGASFGSFPISPTYINVQPSCSGCPDGGGIVAPPQGTYDNLHLFLSPNGTPFDYLSKWEQLYATFKLLDRDSVFRVSRPEYVLFYDSVQTTAMGLLGRADNMMAQLGKCHCAAATGCLTAANPTNFMESGVKDYLTALVAITEKRDTILDTLLTDRLQSIANVSVLEGGYPTVAARAVLNTYNRQPIYYGVEFLYQQDTLPVLEPKKEQTLHTTTEIQLYPNPNQGTFTVSCKLEEKECGTLYIKNVLGQSVAERTLESGEKVHDIAVNELSEGAYLCQIRVNGQLKATYKLIITQ